MNLLKKRIFYNLLLILIIALSIFLRFYQLGYIPNGLYPDETAIGYNAFSILINGKDEHGQYLPLYFRSFDDYKFPGYIYSVTLAIKQFGVNDFSVRIPSAFFGVLAVIALYFLIFESSKDKALSLVAAFSLAINPWHTFFSRAGYEVNMATSLMLIGMLFFVLAVKRKNNILFFSLSVISFLAAIYTYNVSRLIAPLLFLTILFIYFKKILKQPKKTLIIPILILFIGIIPMVFTFFTMQTEAGFSTHKDALIIGNVTKADLLQTRSYFVNLPPLIQKIVFNYPFMVIMTYVKNLVSFFSTAFFFVTGSDKPNQNLGGGLAMFYYFEFPLIIAGAYYGLKNRVSCMYPFYYWFLIVFLVASSVIIVPNGTRAYSVVIPLVVFSAYGLTILIKRLNKLKNNLLKYSSFSLVAVVILYSVIFYYLSYFYRMPVEFAIDWRSEDQKAAEYIKSIENKYQKIVFDDSSEFFYTSMLFYSAYSPEKHQKQAVYKQSGLVSTLASSGKYEFRKVDWNTELKNPDVLYITGKNNVPENINPLKVFTYPTRPVVLYYDRQIGQFPTTDVAYIIFSSTN